MRTIPNLVFCIIALALMALAPSAGVAQVMRGPVVVAQASDADDDGEDVPPRRRGTAEEADDPSDDSSTAMPSGMGAAASGVDIIDAANDDPKGVVQAQDTVVCVAGCEGPRGAIVYKKPRS